MRQLLRPKWVAMTGQQYVNPFQQMRALELALKLKLTARTREVPNYAVEPITALYDTPLRETSIGPSR